MNKEQIETFEIHANAVCNECIRHQLNIICAGCVVDILCDKIAAEFVEEYKDD